MKANGIIFRTKPYEIKNKNVIFLLTFNSDTGILNNAAIQLKGKNKYYQHLQYNQIEIVNWIIRGKNKKKLKFTFTKLDTLDLQDSKTGEEIPIYISIMNKEFAYVWNEIWNSRIKQYNMSFDKED